MDGVSARVWPVDAAEIRGEYDVAVVGGRPRGAVPGILIAGDNAGIAGGQSAAWRGVLCANAIVNAIRPGRKLPVDKLARTALSQFGRGRKFLDALYRPARDREAGDWRVSVNCVQPLGRHGPPNQ